MRQRSPDYINLWFKWQWISVASRIVRAIASGLYIVIGLVVAAVDPSMLMDYIYLTFGLLALVILGRIVAAILMAFRALARAGKPRGEWVPAGELGNPPMPWLAEDGTWLWSLSPDGWVPATIRSRELQRLPSSPTPHSPTRPAGNRDYRIEPQFGIKQRG